MRLGNSPPVVFIIPVLARPHRVQPLLDSIEASMSSNDYHALFICDSHDTKERDAVKKAGAETLIVDGNYATKINAGVRVTDEPLIFTGADDLHFHKGWFQAAVAKMTSGIGVVGTNDLCNPKTRTGKLSTHSLVARWYAELGTIDEPDKLLHESYPHEWVDNEFIETAKFRKAFAHAPNSIVEHLHQRVGKAPMDDLYAGRSQRMRKGKPIFLSRRPLWS